MYIENSWNQKELLDYISKDTMNKPIIIVLTQQL